MTQAAAMQSVCRLKWISANLRRFVPPKMKNSVTAKSRLPACFDPTRPIACYHAIPPLPIATDVVRACHVRDARQCGCA
jgi:hypothetical protein